MIYLLEMEIEWSELQEFVDWLHSVPNGAWAVEGDWSGQASKDSIFELCYRKDKQAYWRDLVSRFDVEFQELADTLQCKLTWGGAQ